MLANEASFSSQKLHLMKPAVRWKAADPAKVVSAHRTLHLRTALVLFYQRFALRAVASRRPGLVGLPRLDVAVLRTVLLVMVVLTAFAASLTAAVCTNQLFTDGLANVQHILAVGLRTEHEIFTVFCHQPIALKVVIFQNYCMIAVLFQISLAQLLFASVLRTDEFFEPLRITDE